MKLISNWIVVQHISNPKIKNVNEVENVEAFHNL